MLFNYKAIDSSNIQREGTVEASTVDAAITAVQKRGYTLISISEVGETSGLMGAFNIEFAMFQSVSNKEVVILSRQIATLFQAQVSPLRIFRLLSAEIENPRLKSAMNQIVEDLQGGNSISKALSVHSDIFSSFYINLVKAGEESGSLEKTFDYLADYLDRQYEVISKARNALVYPAFVITIFIGVMAMMLTLVIPNIAAILSDSGQELPIYTKIVIGISDFMVDYIALLLFIIALGGIGAWRFSKTEVGKRTIDGLLISLPYLGDLQRKLLLTRICDNMSTMLGSGISIVQALEVTADVVDNAVYREIIESALTEVKGGRSFADSIAEYPEIPGVLAQMVKVGEETGSLATILTTLSNFYRREVNNAVDTLIGLIEPAMIVLLGLGVGVLLASVLMPIYNMTSAF
ncbi:type II secretion system F family protein [Candidatus Kaiserbacteria bacterium]|nr:type II secretion system F family protein [Candidatus Kaiserbacteria bacterium]USN92335.1 MAG: type II secretion system F family protein [Candidatus Nomurabacteria bacterium]